jgi:hypothetical protein
MLDAVLGLPVSGMKISSPTLFSGVDLGPVWLTGGNYGIEGGVACTVALILATLFVWRTRLVTADPEMVALSSRENPSSVMAAIVPTSDG